MNSSPVSSDSIDLKKLKQKQITSLLIPLSGLIAIILFAIIGTQGRVLRTSNLVNIIDQMFTTMIVSCGAIFIYAHGGFDMSLAASLGVSEMVMLLLAVATDYAIPPVLLMLVGVAVCVAIGLLNGLIHTKLRVPIFVATLCTSFACTGLLTSVSGNQSLSMSLSYLEVFLSTPVRAVVLVAIVGTTYVLFEYTKLGKMEKAVGGSRVVAAQSGIRVDRTIILAFVICGICTGIAAIFQLARMCRVNGASGGTVQLNVMIAIVLGGMPLSGGSASKIRSVIVGALSITILTNGMQLMGIDTGIVNAVKGLLFILIVTMTYKRPANGVIE